MVNFAHKSRRGLALFIIPTLVLAQETLPISLDADSSSFDRESNSILFNGLSISQGDLTIEADEAEATGLDFEMSEWAFKGNVRISIDSTNINASTAEVSFQSHKLRVVRLRGDPAIFEDFSASRDVAIQGGASTLEYDNQERTLRMTDGAWLSEGSNEFRGCDLIYDIDEEKITSGSSDCGEPIIITILPPPVEQTDATSP
jgi:lipopolysaccharide transport protein LptA